MVLPVTMDDWVTYDLETAFEGLGPGEFVTTNLYAYEDAVHDIGDLEAGLCMQWGPDPQAAGNFIGGWKYVYPEDPNLLNCKLIVDVIPPNVSPATGAFVTSVGLGLVDGAGAVRSWTWNCALAAGDTPPVPGSGTLAWNVPNWVEILVKPSGAGSAADATHGLAGPGGPFPWDYATYFETPGFNPANVVWLVGFENGAVPAGGWVAAPPPGTAPGGPYVRSPWNWWGLLAVQPADEVPEPVTMLSLAAGLCAFGGYLRRRRRTA
jgi:hypothetical protein